LTDWKTSFSEQKGIEMSSFNVS